MKKAIIYGAFSFVGYQLCRHMLNQEIEVVGIDFEPREGSPEENNMLRIGRNAYFTFVNYDTNLLRDGQLQVDDTDLFVYSWIGCYENKDEEIRELLEHCSRNNSKFILVSTHKCSFGNEDELDEQWYNKLNIKNSFMEHRLMKEPKGTFLFTFINFSGTSVQEGLDKVYEHKEWLTKYNNL
ncbi:hypothetical protein [Fredinandcohnia sp. 179-A 10B2 NHS]|uniref:hypothetical protein n=1 Tax=Fredinandcohnia sp. 179-A 10B2 NHS TaxID=3235176 RepID=UPI0039A346F4